MRRIFYDLFFSYDDNIGNHYFHIGYFSSETKVFDVVEMLKQKPGFRDYWAGFHYNKFEIHLDGCCPNNEEMILYELSHEKRLDDGTDYFTILGVFSSYSSAYRQLLVLSQHRAYADCIEGFYIAEKRVDMVCWSDGFVTF